MQQLIIVGGGEHASVVADAARSVADVEIAGFVDPAPREPRGRQREIRRFTTDEEAMSHGPDVCFVLGIGGIDSGALRRQLVDRYNARGVRWHTVIHASASVSPAARVGAGAVVLAGAVVNTGAVVGAHSIVNSGAIIEHDVKLGDFSVAAPGAVVGGGVLIDEDCYLGLGCRIRDHVVIGRGSVVGMGAVVVASLPAGVEAIGVPARARPKGNHGHPS